MTEAVSDKVTDLVAEFSVELIDKEGFPPEFVIESFVAGAYILATKNGLEDHLMDVLDHVQDKLDPL